MACLDVTANLSAQRAGIFSFLQCRLEAELSALEEQRYRRFAAAVKETNVHLSAIFCRLSGHRGDAYCSHADNVKLAFAQGLDFHVRREAYLTQSYRSLPSTAKPATDTRMM